MAARFCAWRSLCGVAVSDDFFFENKSGDSFLARVDLRRHFEIGDL